MFTAPKTHPSVWLAPLSFVGRRKRAFRIAIRIVSRYVSSMKHLIATSEFPEACRENQNGSREAMSGIGAVGFRDLSDVMASGGRSQPRRHGERGSREVADALPPLAIPPDPNAPGSAAR